MCRLSINPYLLKCNRRYYKKNVNSSWYVMHYAIWYHLYNFKNSKNTNGGVLLLVKLQAITKSNTPPWVFFTFFKLYKWYQIAQRITYKHRVICEKWYIEEDRFQTIKLKYLRHEHYSLTTLKSIFAEYRVQKLKKLCC